MAKDTGKKSSRKAKNEIKLTGKQERFCYEYLVDLNATQAAIRAGYSPEVARQTGSENLTKADIKRFLRKLKRERIQRTKVKQDEVIRELVAIAFADIRDFLSFRTEKTQVGIDKKTGEPIFDYDTIIDVKDSDQVNGRLVAEISRGKDGSFKFKLHDKMNALEKLGKHLGMFKENIDHTGEVGLNLKIDYGNEDCTTISAGDNNDS